MTKLSYNCEAGIDFHLVTSKSFGKTSFAPVQRKIPQICCTKNREETKILQNIGRRILSRLLDYIKVSPSRRLLVLHADFHPSAGDPSRIRCEKSIKPSEEKKGWNHILLMLRVQLVEAN